MGLDRIEQRAEDSDQIAATGRSVLVKQLAPMAADVGNQEVDFVSAGKGHFRLGFAKRGWQAPAELPDERYQRLPYLFIGQMPVGELDGLVDGEFRLLDVRYPPLGLVLVAAVRGWLDNLFRASVRVHF